MIPSDFPPPTTPQDFIGPSTAAPENRMEVGVLFVGAGPANLAGAIRLMQLLDQAPEIKSALGDIPVAIVEKGKYVGAHLLAGAVTNPISLKRLFPQLREGDFPLDVPVHDEAFYFLTKQKSWPLPIPPTMRNHGNFAVSLSRLGRWMGEHAEQRGISIFCETPAVSLLVENGVVRGIRTGDKGRDRSGAPLSNFQEGIEISARTTVLGEGGQGHLTHAMLSHFGVKRANPQTYSLGVKEIWEVRRGIDRVIHTMGWPLRGAKKYREFGGAFLYPMGPNKASLGLVVGLGYRDATISVHDLLQQVKTHPLFRAILEGGERIAWGAKTIPEGGYYSVPERLALPGALVVGDGAGFLNVPALKGIHYAMASGMVAAETIFSALKNGTTKTVSEYDTVVRNSFIMNDLYRVRNMRQAFDYGFWPGVALAGLMTATRSLFPGWRFQTTADRDEPLFIGKKCVLSLDGRYRFDKLSSVYLAGNKSRDDQPNHIRIQTQVPEAVGEAWINMCPANVYEWAPISAGTPAAIGAPTAGPTQPVEQPLRSLAMNPTNCVQCGAISAKGGQLTPPEGGSGPEYKET